MFAHFSTKFANSLLSANQVNPLQILLCQLLGDGLVPGYVSEVTLPQCRVSQAESDSDVGTGNPGSVRLVLVQA